MKVFIGVLITAALLFCCSPSVFASAEYPKLVAQSGGDDNFDPFADYSEFEEASEEEADIYFFRHGRFFTLGFVVGSRGFTDTFSSIYGPAPVFGLFLCYFFDMRFAMQLGFHTGDHAVSIVGPTQKVSGVVSLSDVSVNLKYYFNTQNMTRGLAGLNPYMIGGFSRVDRKISLIGQDLDARESVTGVNVGAGFEIPMLRNKMFWGLQGAYQLVTFSDEGREIILANQVSTGVVPRGDIYTLLGVLGINF